MPPGIRIRVHVPVDGNPVNITLPVDTVQVGWLMVPITGALGVDDCALITTLVDALEIQPDAFVTVKVKVPVGRPDIFVLLPVPVVVVPPGERVIVHVPVDGNPFNSVLPVATVQVGCVTVPTTGGVGADGCVFITTLPDATEIQPAAATV